MAGSISLRSVFTNTYYRFVIVAPSTLSNDDIVSALEQRGWEVKSLGVPPPELAKVISHDIASPKVLWVHATWRKPTTMIPNQDDVFYYGPLELLQSNETVPKPTGDDNSISTVATVLSFVVGAAMVGYGLYIYNKRRY